MSTKWRDTLHPVMLGVWAGVIGFGSFARILTPYGVSLSLLDVFSLLLLVSLGLPKIRKSEIANPLVDFFAYLTIVFVLTIPFFSLRTNTYGLLYLGRLLVYVALVVQLGAMRRELLFRSFCICLLVIFFTTILQYLYLPSLSDLMYIGWDEHAGRLFGSFFDAHIAGVVYGLSLVGLYLLSKKSEEGKESKRSEGSESSKVSEKSKKSWERVLLGVGITLAGGALVLSFSRLAWVSVAAAFFYAWSSWKVRLWGIVVGIILFGFLIMFNPVKLGSEATHLLRTSTVSSRFVDIQKGITLGLQYPLVGVGYNRLPFYKKSQESAKPFEVIEHHASGGYPSVLVTIFVTGGIIGLLLFLRLCWWLWSISNDEQHLILSLVFIASLFESTLLIPIIISYTALLWWMVKEVKSEKS